VLPSLEGQRLVMIGGSAGMGRGIAGLAAEAGAKVTIAARDEGRVKEASASMKGDVEAVTLDLLDEGATRAFFETVGPFDHLAVTAHYSSVGVSAVAPITELAVENGKKFMEGKFWAPLTAVKYAVPVIAERGSITLFSGVASHITMPGHGAMAAVNAAVEAFGRQMARELAPIRVNVISPGLVDTPTYDGMPAERREAMFDRRAAAQPVGRTGTPDDIANAALFLMTNGYVTGQIIVVDGGHSVE
jgi:NAD(P)-dependent dehydrogenase (short-subunit alcohol dehydrogenase family)